MICIQLGWNGSSDLKKKIFKCLHFFFTFWLRVICPLGKRHVTLLEQTWIPLRQECFVCQVVLEKKMKTYNDDDDDDIWQKAHTRRKWLNSITMQRTSSKYTYTSLKLGWQLSDFQSFHLSSDLFPVRFVSLNPISKANFVAEEGNAIFVTNWQKTIYNMRTWIIICC